MMYSMTIAMSVSIIFPSINIIESISRRFSYLEYDSNLTDIIGKRITSSHINATALPSTQDMLDDG